LIPKTGKVMAYTLLITVGICFVRPLCAKSLSLNTNYFSLPDRHPVAKAGYSNMSQDLQDLVLFIQSRTTDNEAIYVGVKNHDRFITNSVIVYFLANRKCATKYHELHPGVATTSNVQKEIIGELKDPSVKLVILRLGFQEEQNDSRIDSKVDLLDSYILTNFEMIRTFGSYEVWSRKTEGR